MRDRITVPFILQKGEKILEEMRPERNYVGRAMLSYFLVYFFVALVILLFVGPVIFATLGNQGLYTLVSVYAFLLAIPLIISYLVAWLSYTKYHYWITNHRVIGQRGLLGFSVDSIPMEEVSGVIISRSVLDRIFDLSNVVVIPVGGGIGLVGELSAVNTLQSLKPKKAIEIQNMILELRSIRKKEARK